MKKFYNLKEAAKYLEVHPITVSRYCKSGNLTYYQIGTRKRFLQEDLDNFIKGAIRNAQSEPDEPTTESTIEPITESGQNPFNFG